MGSRAAQRAPLAAARDVPGVHNYFGSQAPRDDVALLLLPGAVDERSAAE